MKLGFSVAVLFAAAASPAWAVPPPDGVKAMIDAALAGKDPATIAAVLATAKRAAPDSAHEIDALVADYNARQAASPAGASPPADHVRAEAAASESASIFSGWKGELELGGSQSTGNSRTLGLYGAVNLARVMGEWTHKLTVRADYEQTASVPTTERVVAAYQPQRALDGPLYAYGLTEYEHDRFLGYRNRYTLGAGMGLSAVSRWDLKMDFDAGPAVRHTQFYAKGGEDQLAGRASISIKWLLSKSLTVAQDAAVYVDGGDTTARSTTSVDTRLIGPLKARLSYNVQYEQDAPVGQKQVDTVSRATLVYGF